MELELALKGSVSELASMGSASESALALMELAIQQPCSAGPGKSLFPQ